MRTFVRPIDEAGDEAMLLVIEGKLMRLTHDVPTLRMERIPIGTVRSLLKTLDILDL